MRTQYLTLGALIFVCALRVPGQPIEPQAGNWKTWFISSGKDFRVPPPPDARATAGELLWLRDAVAEPDSSIANAVTVWSAGAPSYQWMELLHQRGLNGAPLTPYPHRVFTYVALAMHDATVATWESKYFYNRPRPLEVDPKLNTRLPTPRSPSYPSEHAATAAAAAAVLAYFFPNEAESFQAMAEEAGKSQLYAGLAFPSDYFAGMDLGRKVAARVIEAARLDGSDAVWAGTVPTGKCNWLGANPGNVTATAWKPLLLSSPGEFRPPAPPDCDSAQVVAELADVRSFPRSTAAFATNQRAMYWQSPEGLNSWPYVYTSKWMFEDKMEQNAPRWARAYALIAAAMFDAFIASQDGKFTYWYIRPPQLDPAIIPLFPVPNHPSYPSNHSTFSATRAETLAYLVPARADFARAFGKEGGDSRIWAGIHYQMDNEAGVALGKALVQKFMAWARSDGSQ